jgi:glycosyltransferase involved in cell wall biosynthesis
MLSSAGFFPQSFGGGEMYVYRLAKELLVRRHEVTVVTPAQRKGGDSISHYVYDDVPVVSLAMDTELVGRTDTTTGYGLSTSAILRKVVAEISPDLIHINGIKPELISLCKERTIPHVVTAHHAGIVCPAGGLLRPDGSVCDSQITPKNCVPCCNFHRRPKWYTGGLIGRIPSWIYRPLGERLGKAVQLNYLERGLITSWLIERTIKEKQTNLQDAQLFIAPSIFMRDLLVRSGCNPDKVVVIPHGIEPVKAVPLQSKPGMPVRFGYVGRIDPSKGLHVLLQAAELLPAHPACEVHIFGAARNPWHEAYRKKTLSNYGGKALIIDHGLMPHDSLDEVYGQLDVLVVPSLLPEAFGLVVAEAFSAGRPVIVFNSGALPELVTHGKDGLIVQDNSDISLAAAMKSFTEDPRLILQMSEQIPHVKTIQEHVDELEELYKKLASNYVSPTAHDVRR